MRHELTFAALAASVLVSCADGPGVISIDDRTGTVRGIAYVDRNSDGQLTAGIDGPAGGVVAAVLLQATGDTVVKATTELDGTFILSRVPVGEYRLVGRRGALGDTLDVLPIDSAQFEVAANDTTIRHIRLGYPTITVAEARQVTSARRVIVSGIALNGWSAFADSSIHLADATGTLRAIRIQPGTVQAGDSIRLLGTTGTSGGHFVLADGSAQILSAAVGLPPADSISTAAAATAQDGAAPDAQVRIAGAVIVDTTSLTGDRILGVDDGSGRLEVILDRDITFDAGPFVPGATFHATGVLLPGPAGSWRLKPRERADATVTFPTVSTAEARALEPGRQVVLQGIALNATAAFADSTIHLRDAAGSMRAVRAQGNVAAGDSVRLLGTVATRDGQPVLTAVTASVLVAGVGLPALDSITTASAATAVAGTRDADQVRIGGTIVGVQSIAGGDQILFVDDGSGRIDILFDKDVAFSAGPYQVGALLRASGVLVPTGTGTWQLKPRSSSDATATYPTVTVDEARMLPPDRTVYVRGLALTRSNNFGDGAAHILDATGALRIFTSGTFSEADTIRILGTTGQSNGQPVLTGSSLQDRFAGNGLPTPDSITTAVAATAEGGSRDAAQAAVSGEIKSLLGISGELIITLDDGSGPLTVVLDRDIGFPTGGYTIGQNIRARGVLVPTTAGNTWQLKPRSTTDVGS